METKNKKIFGIDDNYLKSIFFAGTFILLFIFMNIFISSALFIFHVSIMKWYAILALILSIVVTGLFLKKAEILEIKYAVIAILLPIILIFFSIYANGKMIDSTYDGNSYHKVTVGTLASGWNPLYESMEEFDRGNEFSVFVKEGSSVWGEHYAKASHIFAANIYSLVGNIESGKCINTLSILMLFLIILSILLHHFKKVFFSFIFSICFVTVPVVCSQYLTFYVDSLVYIYLMTTLLYFFCKEEEFIDGDIMLLYFFASLVITINIKFSVFGYAGLFCLGYYIWYIVRLIKKKLDKKFFIKFSVTSLLAVLCGVFVVGLSVYPKNFLDHGHPFYPLMGKDKLEIMIQNQPDYFKEKSAIEKFVIATFSKVENISESSGLEATYKIPFTFSRDEIATSSGCDTRISGNGILFSGIFIISIIVIIATIGKVFKNNRKLFWLTIIPVGITIAMIFLLSESWWARYFPQLHFIVFTSILYLKLCDSKISNAILYGLIGIILINNFVIFCEATKYAYHFSKDVNNSYYAPELGGNCKLDLYSNGFPGSIYNAIDRRGYKNVIVLDPDIYEYEPGSMLPVVPPYLVGICRNSED